MKGYLYMTKGLPQVQLWPTECKGIWDHTAFDWGNNFWKSQEHWNARQFKTEKKMMGLFLWQNERHKLQISGLGDSDELSTGKQTFRDQSGMQPFDWTECYRCFKKGNSRSKVHTFWNELNRNCIKYLHLLRNKLSYK